MENSLDIGSTAPDFKLAANTGKDVRLVDYKGSANVILFFVREYN